ncbi:hypothetical protein MJO29_013107 [Puccinia striiformis f. sp. tritici]|nr:hypothetical protein MJO29_013107 [Puccinia striiformis f. sp. tritici]
MADWKSQAIQTNPTHQLTFDLLITAILQMKNLLSNNLQLVKLNISLVNFQLRKSAISLHDDMTKSRLNQSKGKLSILLSLIKELSSARYVVPRTPLPRIATISRTYEVLTNTTEGVFKIYARMTWKSFFSLANTLKDHYIFYNNSNNPQAPVEMQLIVALSHLGMCGNGGSPHVLAQFTISALYRNPQHFFSPGEYLLADSAYTSTNTVIPAFKRAPGRSLPPEKQLFNHELSHNRVIVEHTIGMLKNRWQSLKSLSIEILGKKTAKRLNTWLRACVVSHNYLLDLCEAEWDELNNPVQNFNPDEDEEDDSGVISGEDFARRDLLFRRFSQLL